MARIFFDTNLFIYLFENNPAFTPSARLLRERMLAAHAELVTSTMALAEVLAGPRKAGNAMLAQQYGEAIRSVATVISFDERSADIYSLMRAQNRIAQPDAIQLACAATYGVELFVTNDERLQRVRVDGVHFTVSIETALKLI